MIISKLGLLKAEKKHAIKNYLRRAILSNGESAFLWELNQFVAHAMIATLYCQFDSRIRPQINVLKGAKLEGTIPNFILRM
jgi:hypothetical protein